MWQRESLVEQRQALGREKIKGDRGDGQTERREARLGAQVSKCREHGKNKREGISASVRGTRRGKRSKRRSKLAEDGKKWPFSSSKQKGAPLLYDGDLA